MRVCATPGCPTLTDSTRCEPCRRGKRRVEDRRRPNSRKRGYDKQWERTRAAFLRAHPTCQDRNGCILKATDVHHLDGQGPNGPRGHDWDNLRALCHPHHSRVTSREQPGGFRGGG